MVGHLLYFAKQREFQEEEREKRKEKGKKKEGPPHICILYQRCSSKRFCWKESNTTTKESCSATRSPCTHN